MTIQKVHDHTTIIAEPMADRAWRVCDGEGENAVDSTIGFIGELGGTYEVRVLRSPERHRFVTTFKEAMECFGAVAS
ncbi:MAG TPA: hypothetical protein PK781_03090 [Terrimesophilobacter sp.]|nr:hypothetical protein [Terrimesophilobacter sp.]